MRIYLYILAGVTSALIGWNIGQFFLADLGLLKLVPEIVLFPCIAISLAVGMVMNEIFVSSPTRPKLSFSNSRIPITIALGLGVLTGLIAGILSIILLLPQIPIPAFIVRMISWILIGSSVGFAEGLTWRWHSVEAGNKKRFRQRLKNSVIAASIASLFAALLFELIRLPLGQMPTEFKRVEEPIGISILGMLLGLGLSYSTSPSYLAALRAGAGFEYTGEKYDSIDSSITNEDKPYPTIDNSLKFVSKGNTDEIEEGLSIQLPEIGKITIGSDDNASIRLPGIPPEVAFLELQKREAFLVPNKDFIRIIKVNNQPLKKNEKISLKHNYVLTFHTLEQDEQYEKKFYRFVYYNRFLDPQA
jgi:thiamine transporter ThiT